MLKVRNHNATWYLGGGVLPNFQYGEVHANIWGLKFYVNQYLGSVNYNMEKNSIFRVHKSEKKEESWNLVRVSKLLDSIFGVSKLLDSIFGVPKMLGSIFGDQQGNSGMDPPPELKVGECPPWDRVCQ